MSMKRMVRVNELLKQELATALFRIMNDRGFDLSAVSLTRVITSSDLRTARVLVSVRDHAGEREAILRRLAHHRKELQDVINERIALKFTPRLAFELDESVEQGDHVLQIISEMEQESRPEDAGGEVGDEK